MIKLKEKRNRYIEIATKQSKGITLIALIVTIVVMIVVAGVSINMTVGENGIFNKAKFAKEKYTNEEYLEQEQLNEIYAYLNKDSKLPENTKDTEINNDEYIDDKSEEVDNEIKKERDSIFGNDRMS